MLTQRITKYKEKPTYNHYSGITVKPAISQPELIHYLDIHDLSVGDWCGYVKNKPGDIIYPERCFLVVEVCVLLSELQVDAWNNPKPYLLMGLNGTGQNCRNPEWKFNTDPWVRWDDGNNLHRLTEEQKLQVNDDFVQNYIKKHLSDARKYLR
jgi:hypothetical protein